jgi:hypothetical protein
MIPHEIIQWGLGGLAGAYLIWSIIRSRKSLRLQQEAAIRAKTIIESDTENQKRYNDAIDLQREQIQLTKDLIKEIQGLRDDINKKGI